MSSDDDMQKAANCTSIDYVWLTSCGDCRQETLDSWKLSSITGKSPAGFSLVIAHGGTITSYRALGGLTGALPGGIFIDMPGEAGPTTLDGLQGLTSVGTGFRNWTTRPFSDPVSLVLSNNANLEDASALGNASFSGALYLLNNPKLDVFSTNGTGVHNVELELE